MKITLIIRQEDGFFIGQLKELPEVISQGATREELTANIQDALELYLEDMREEYQSQESQEEKELYQINACV